MSLIPSMQFETQTREVGALCLALDMTSNEEKILLTEFQSTNIPGMTERML